MPSDKNPIDTKMRVLIDEYVEKQDLHTLETPLKTEKQLKDELRQKLLKQQSFTNISKGFLNAIRLINEHLNELNDEKQTQKVREEIEHAFKVVRELLRKRIENESEDINQWNLKGPIWSSLYGVSNQTLMMIYDIVLACYNNQEIANAKDLLQILLIFAPTVPDYWNALGFCFQAEEDYEQALRYYLIAEEADPDLLDTHFYLARCYLGLNKKPLAIEEIEKLRKLLHSSKEQNQWKNAVEGLANEISKK